MDDDVSTELLLLGAGAGRGTRLRLSWRCDDPLAVTLALRPEPDHPALARGDWVVLRDFLRYGLDVATGDGDVRLHPRPDAGELLFELRRDGRQHQVLVPSWSVREFLDETDRMVPTGEERSDEAIDALIVRLLGS